MPRVANTGRPVGVVVVRMEFRTVSKLSSGRPVQLRPMKPDRRNWIRFHWLRAYSSDREHRSD